MASEYRSVQNRGLLAMISWHHWPGSGFSYDDAESCGSCQKLEHNHPTRIVTRLFPDIVVRDLVIRKLDVGEASLSRENLSSLLYIQAH